MGWLIREFSKKTIFIFALFVVNCVNGQVNEFVKDLEKKYPNENFLKLLESKKYRIEMKDNKPKVFLDIYSEEILMNEMMTSAQSGEASYSKLRKLKDLEAWTMTPVKDEYKKVKVSQFSTKKELGSQIFHDDIESKVFKFPELKKGAKRCQKESYEFELPEIFDYTILMSGYPILKYEVEIEVDNEVALNYKQYNLDSIPFGFKKTIGKNTTIYRWDFENLKKYKSESLSTPFLYFAPHIRFLIDYYIGKNDDTIRVLQNPQHLYNFNYQFISKLKECNNANLKKTIDSLISGEKDDEIKAKKIYYWVKKNIKYIAFESGFQGYIPREADDIFEKKFGDCKDMANILHKSFKYAKLDSIYLTWVGTDDLPYRIEDFAHPGAFNHMIAVWKHRGRNYILDATNSYTIWGTPSGFVQSKQGFLSIDDKTFEILPIQSVDFMENRKTKNVNIELSSDTLKGSMECILSGYTKDYFLMRIDGQKDNERFQTLKNFMEVGNNKFVLKNLKEYNFDNLDSPLRITCDFHIVNYISKLKDEIFINLFLEKYGTVDDLNDRRISDFKTEFKSIEDVNIELKIPEGYNIKYIPKNENIEYPEFYFNSIFEDKQDKIMLKYEYVNDFIFLQKEKYKSLKEYQNKILEIISETISLKKTP